MKQFDDIEMTSEEVKPQVYDKYALQKQKLIFNVTREQEVCDALLRWLMSFQGGMSKEAFTSQVSKLSFQTSEALQQIEKSVGKRSIAKIKEVQAPLPEVGDVIQMLADGVLFIAVSGTERALHAFIRNTYQTLKRLGRTYVLDLNDLRLEWVDKFQKGKSPQMIQSAKDAEFLLIVGFETPIDLPFYIGDTLNTLRRYRVEHKMPMISTYARFRQKEKFFQYFKKYRAK